MITLTDEYTSTGSKLFWHQEALRDLRNGKGRPITTHVMCTDRCNFSCSFCSVQHRAGDTLPFAKIMDYLKQLVPLGLKSVILSGGGNPLLYRDGQADFNTLVEHIHGLGLEIGLITNGLPLVTVDGRATWKGVKLSTIDKCTWIRLSLSGWDHEQDRCDTPDIDPSITTLGGSYVLHDTYDEPADKKHGRVSTLEDVITPGMKVVYGVDRLPGLKDRMAEWNARYHPAYVRLLPNCLEPSLIPQRIELLQRVANEIDPNVFFVQNKMPRQPAHCVKGYGHPICNADGWIYPCDSTVLSRTAGHKFGSAWRICRMEDIGKFYAEPVRANVPNNICEACVFSDQVDLIAGIADGSVPIEAPVGPPPQHVNFV